MTTVELFIIACGLSMDAFAVSLCKGLRMRSHYLANGLIIALTFALFQALMPIIGWTIGSQFKTLVCTVAQWVAFLILVSVGIKMLYDSLLSPQACETKPLNRIQWRALIALGIATSLDALAVGFSFSMLEVQILSASLLIAVVTFSFSLLALAIGNRWGIRLQKKAGMAGGGILMLIAVKILVTSF